MSEVQMKGWKTKWGSVTLIVGQVLMGAAAVAPIPPVAVWMGFIGKILTGVGSGLTAWGIGHKIEKAAVMDKPVYLKPDPPSITKE